jgi:hypothetical protein
MDMPRTGYRLYLVTQSFQVFSPYNRKKLLPVNQGAVAEIWADTGTGGDDVKVWLDERDLRAEPVLFAKCTQLKMAGRQ